MTHGDKGAFQKKHPPNKRLKPSVADPVKEQASEKGLSCAAAHNIASDLGESPAEIGFTLDFLELQIIKCQMGLFGYAPEKKVVKPAKAVTDALEKALREKAVNDRISCRSTWDIAEKMGEKKIRKEIFLAIFFSNMGSASIPRGLTSMCARRARVAA